MVFNKSDETKNIELKINNDGKLTILRETSFYDCEAVDGIVTLTVAPHDMQILILTKPGIVLEGLEFVKEEKTPVGTVEEIVLDRDWKVETGNNILPLRIKYLTKAEPCGVLCDEIQKMAETADVPYAIQEFPVDVGVSFGDGYAAYARFEVDSIPEYTEIFSEVVDDGELWLNGEKLDGFKKVFERGPKDSTLDITAKIKKGTNVVVVIHRMPNWKCAHKMPALNIRGKFCLDKNEHIIEPTDSIDITNFYTVQGWRYYSGDLKYINTFNLDCDNPKKVSIKVKTKEVAEIIVNGVSAGIYCWHPYEADITSLCKAGENRVEVIFTTTYEPTMVLENIVYIAQGISEYREDVKPQEVGTNTPPVITIIK